MRHDFPYYIKLNVINRIPPATDADGSEERLKKKSHTLKIVAEKFGDMNYSAILN